MSQISRALENYNILNSIKKYQIRTNYPQTFDEKIALIKLLDKKASAARTFKSPRSTGKKSGGQLNSDDKKIIVYG